MKICWDTLDGVVLNSRGNFNKGSSIYIYKEACLGCGESYLTVKSINSNYCSNSCSRVGDRNSFYGKTHSKETKDILSKHFKGKKLSIDRAIFLSKKFKGEGNPNYKGGVKKLNIPLYDSYSHKIDFAEQTRKSKEGYLETKCSYCGRWFVPKTTDIVERIKGLNGKGRGERRLYCTDNCKKECSIYGMRRYPKGYKLETSREVQPELRQLVLERDNWTCQICGMTINDGPLECHHITGVVQNPIESADLDNCVTLCKEHHKEIHKLPGCRYTDLQCKNN